MLSSVRADEDETIVTSLIAAGASTEPVDSSGNKAAHYATNADIRIALGLRPMTPRETQTMGGQRDLTMARRASVVNVAKDVASLFNSISDGDVDQVLAILDAGVDVDSRDDDGNTPLILAAEGEHAIVEKLLERGANIDSQNRNGLTALIAAVKYEDPALVAIFIKAGATLDLRDRKGRRAADFAKECDKTVEREMAQLFGLNNGKKAIKVKGRHARRRKSMVNVDATMRKMFEIVGEGDVIQLREMLDQGCSVNAADDDGNTALIFAAESEPLIVELLISAGATIDQPNNAGITPLMVAVRNEEMESIRFLIESGASTACCNKQGQTVIELARESGSESVMRACLGLGDGPSGPRSKTPVALPMEVMRRGSLPSCTGVSRRVRVLLESVTEGDIERMRRLLDMGIELESQDDVGNVALHFAAEGEPKLCRELIERGAKPDIQNKQGTTPLMAAISFGDVDCVKLLIEAGARIDLVDRNGLTALELAQGTKKSMMISLTKQGKSG